MRKEPNPCPFCKSPVTELKQSGNWPTGNCYWVECAACDAQGPTTEIGKDAKNLKRIAIDKWNAATES